MRRYGRGARGSRARGEVGWKYVRSVIHCLLYLLACSFLERNKERGNRNADNPLWQPRSAER